jgi:hypothetical protein
LGSFLPVFMAHSPPEFVLLCMGVHMHMDAKVYFNFRPVANTGPGCLYVVVADELRVPT